MSTTIFTIAVLSYLALLATVAAQTDSTTSTAAGSKSASASASGTSARCAASLTKCLADIDAGKTSDCQAVLPYPAGGLRSPPPATPGYSLRQVRDGMWAYWDGLYFSLILRGPAGLAIVDVPASLGTVKPTGSRTRVTDAVQDILTGEKSPPKEIHFWLSHPHGDHIGGVPNAYKFLAALYPAAKLRVFAPRMALPLLAAFESFSLPNVTDIVVENRVYSYGKDLDFTVLFLNGHTEADLALHFPKTMRYGGVVYTVDLVFPGAAPFFYFGFARNLRVSLLSLS
jgi:glyoxylase-like metal-dependent hydrolase (beta-lactamase superfamily II)